MLIYKIFVFLGLALIAILAIENFVFSFNVYVFLSMASAWFLVISAWIIWWFIWYGLFWLLNWSKKSDLEDDEDFNF